MYVFLSFWNAILSLAKQGKKDHTKLNKSLVINLLYKITMPSGKMETCSKILQQQKV